MPIGLHGRSPIDVPQTRDRFDLIWIPAFRAYGETGLEQRLAQNGPVIEWLAHSDRKGLMIGASGTTVVLLKAARQTEGLAVPMATPLLPAIRALFPRFRQAPDIGYADHRTILLSSGLAQNVTVVTALFAHFFSPKTGCWLPPVSGNETVMEDTCGSE